MKIDKKKLDIIIARQGLRLGDVMQMTGLSQSALDGVRSGSRQVKPATVGKLARGLGVNIEDILCDEYTESKPLELDISKIEMIMADKGLSLKDIAERSDLAYSTVWIAMQGKTPKLKTISKLANGLDVDIEDISK